MGLKSLLKAPLNKIITTIIIILFIVIMLLILYIKSCNIINETQVNTQNYKIEYNLIKINNYNK